VITGDLSERERHVVCMRYGDRLTLGEIAAVLETTIDSVERILEDVKTRLIQPPQTPK